MKQNVALQIRSLRDDFTAGNLDEKKISKSPIVQFEKWMSEAINAQVNEPNAMTLASASKNGSVDARVVLLRDFNKDGFSFFSNYKSAKGIEMKQNRKVCLNFFWPELQRQVRIQGVIEKLSVRASNLYFASRPRESQIGAWASHQSEALKSRAELEDRFLRIEEKYKGVKIPRPAHWGGYLVKPSRIEFWQGRESRLHDRLLFEKQRNGKWTLSRLNP